MGGEETDKQQGQQGVVKALYIVHPERVQVLRMASGDFYWLPVI